MRYFALELLVSTCKQILDQGMCHDTALLQRTCRCSEDLGIDLAVGYSVVGHVAVHSHSSSVLSYCIYLWKLVPCLSGVTNLRSSKQTRAKWSFPPQDVQVFLLAGPTFHGWAPRRSPYQKHVQGSLRSFIWLCFRSVQWSSSSIPLDESANN